MCPRASSARGERPDDRAPLLRRRLSVLHTAVPMLWTAHLWRRAAVGSVPPLPAVLVGVGRSHAGAGGTSQLTTTEHATGILRGRVLEGVVAGGV